MARAIILVLDSFGIGAAPDAADFDDIGANTFLHIAQKYQEIKQQKINLPQLAKLGLIAATEQASSCTVPHAGGIATKGAYSYAAEISTGKDTPSGHWEMMGVPVLFDWGYFNNKAKSFDDELVAHINKATGFTGMLANCHGSGTDIINQFAAQHISSGLPICYTSADSVFQVAAHEEHFGLDNLTQYCETVRALLSELDLNIGRVIARPFIGNENEGFVRTGNRRDYSVLPPAPTVLDKISAAGGQVISVGKIADIFAHQGITVKTKATGIDALVDATLEHIKSAADNSLIFTNLVNFDQDFGHRRDPIGYAEALQSFDQRLPEIYQQMQDDDILFLIADHGCDPTWHGNDHTREYVPLLAYHHNIASVNLGERTTFADLGQTIAELFKVEKMAYGQSFLSELNFS
ncbi:MAG: phosphopentomutase [Gammaproteobacteria bacterium]|nr:MAG: phosphopentomutase [Gammaproteobacteria bacterium]